jgi:hypothetical protein
MLKAMLLNYNHMSSFMADFVGVLVYGSVSLFFTAQPTNGPTDQQFKFALDFITFLS